MTLSPFEVERREFGRVPFGYKPHDVDQFVDEVHRSLQQLWEDRADVREENERIKERLTRFEQMEDQLKNTLLLAQDSAEKSHEQARRESDLVMREAGQKARDIIHAAHEDKQRLEMVLRDLHSAEQEARQRLRALSGAIMSHLDDTEALVADGAATFRAIVQAHPEANELRASAAADMRAEELAASARRFEEVASTITASPVVTPAVTPAKSSADVDAPSAEATAAEPANELGAPDPDRASGGTPAELRRTKASGVVADAFFDAPPAFDASSVAERREPSDSEAPSFADY